MLATALLTTGDVVCQDDKSCQVAGGRIEERVPLVEAGLPFPQPWERGVAYYFIELGGGGGVKPLK
jgi:hypothetical protein